jgi:putative ubiquitin-RnfH superfamily antitoxin RatB of RatAB toxin-antitoxin module
MHTVLHALLDCKDSGILEKHHGTSAHQAIMQQMVDLTALPGIIDPAEVLRQRVSQSAEAKMFLVIHPKPLLIV